MKPHRKFTIFRAAVAAAGFALVATSLSTAQNAPAQPVGPGPGAGNGAGPGWQANGKPGKPWGGPKWEKLQVPLGLTDDQLEELQTIRSEHRQAVQKVKQDESLTREQRREKIAQLREQMRKEVESVLTAEQVQKLNQLRQQWREKRQKRDCPQRNPQCPYNQPAQPAPSQP